MGLFNPYNYLQSIRLFYLFYRWGIWDTGKKARILTIYKSTILLFLRILFTKLIPLHSLKWHSWLCGMNGRGTSPEQFPEPPVSCTHYNFIARLLCTRCKMRPFSTTWGLRLSVKMIQKLPCWVQEHMVTFFKHKYMHASEGQKLVKMQQRDSWISLLCWTPGSPFLSTSKISDLPEPLSSCEKGRKVWRPIWKASLSILIFWALWLFRMSSLFLLHLSFLLGPGFSFLVCLYYKAHSSWHILLVLSDRLEGAKSLPVLFLILPGQQAYFQR